MALHKKKEGFITAIPTSTGYRIVRIENIVLFYYVKLDEGRGDGWVLLLHNDEKLILLKTITSTSILKRFKYTRLDLLKINATNIVNTDYIHHIQFKNKRCVLRQPFEGIDLVISDVALKNILKKR